MNNLIKILTVLFFSVSLYAETVSVMTFNVENLFDNRNDAYKTDETYLEFSKKQTPIHIKNCEKISTKRWRDDCLYIDWTDEVIEHKLNSIASVILSISKLSIFNSSKIFISFFSTFKSSSDLENAYKLFIVLLLPHPFKKQSAKSGFVSIKDIPVTIIKKYLKFTLNN